MNVAHSIYIFICLSSWATGPQIALSLRGKQRSERVHMCHGETSTVHLVLHCSIWDAILPFFCVSPLHFPRDLSRLCVPSYFDESSVSLPSFLCTFLTFFFFFAVFCCVTSFFPHSELSKDPLPCEGRVEWCWSSCSSCHQRNMTGLTNSPITRSKGESYDLPRNDADQNFTEVQYGSYYYFFFSLSWGGSSTPLFVVVIVVQWTCAACHYLRVSVAHRVIESLMQNHCKLDCEGICPCLLPRMRMCLPKSKEKLDVFTALHFPALNSGCKHRVRGHHSSLVYKTSKMASTSTLTNAFKHPVRRIAGDISVYWKLQASLLDVWSKKCHNCTVLSQSSGVVECRMTSNPW